MPISTRILDATTGRPAAGVRVTLDQRVDGGWRCAAVETTGPDGWVGVPRDGTEHLGQSLVRLRYGTDAYFAELGIAAFYSDISVDIPLAGPGRCEVIVLVAPRSYVVYGGV